MLGGNGTLRGGGGRRLQERDSASSKLKLKKQASLSLGPISTFFHPSVLRDCFFSTDMPSLFFFFLAFCCHCCLPSEIFLSPRNGNVVLLISCVGTAVPDFACLLTNALD